MTVELTRSDRVCTREGYPLGQAYSLYHRTPAADPADPELKLYATYLYVISLEIGDDYYIPIDFVDGRDSEGGRITLTATMAEVMDETWSRIPDFVARGQAREEILPDS